MSKSRSEVTGGETFQSQDEISGVGLITVSGVEKVVRTPTSPTLLPSVGRKTRKRFSKIQRTNKEVGRKVKWKSLTMGKRRNEKEFYLLPVH